MALALLIGWTVADAQSPTLQIRLDAPARCESETTYSFAAPSVSVDWEVSGGQAPYSVLINGELYEGSSGVVEVTCGRWTWDSLGSGPVTIQATVTDAAGRRASALADMYALRVIDSTPRGEYWLRAGETYRIRDLLFTMPLDDGLNVGRYVTGDCANWGPECDDRFFLWRRSPGDTQSSWLAVRRWSASEHSRVLLGEEFEPGEAIDEELNHGQRLASNLFDEVLSLIDNEPRVYQVTQSQSTEDSRMSMTLYAPTYCMVGRGRYQREFVDVSWEIAGGRDPLEVTIAGDRYVGREGRVKVECGFDRPNGILGGHQKIQGTVVDANGRISSARADMYALGWAFVSQENLPAERPYRLHDLVLTPPPNLEDFVDEPENWREFYSHCWINEEQYSDCEDVVRHTFSRDGQTASFVLGLRTAMIHERTPRSETSVELDDVIQSLIDSIGKPPQLPQGFVESNAPLEITALLDPAVCEYRSYGGSANLYLTATGGRWWPLRVTVGGQPAGHRNNRIDCREAAESGEVVVRVSEYGSTPAEEELRLEVVARETDYEHKEYDSGSWLIESRLASSDLCSTGERLSLLETHEFDSTPISQWQANDGRNQWTGVSGISCATQPGWMRLTAQVPSTHGAERLIELSYVLPVHQGRPERSSE